MKKKTFYTFYTIYKANSYGLKATELFNTRVLRQPFTKFYQAGVLAYISYPMCLSIVSEGSLSQVQSIHLDLLIKLCHSITIWALMTFGKLHLLFCDIIIHLINIIIPLLTFICPCLLNLARNTHTQTLGDRASCVSPLLWNLWEINLAPEKSHDQRLVQAHWISHKAIKKEN